MKIPSYQQHISYQFSAARDVPLAQPLKAAQHNKWEEIAAAGKLIAGGVSGYSALKKVLDEKTASEKDIVTRGNPSGPEEVAAEQTPATAYGRFSDPARRNLLAFGRQQTQQAFSGKEINPNQAIAQLDQYMQQQLPPTSWQEEPEQAQSLLAQDYVVLRQELQHLAKQQQQESQQYHFNQGAGHFLETAALIRTPASLETYINNNLEAAGQEIDQDPSKRVLWEAQKKHLYSQAVSHNVETALQAGEVHQAQAVYRHFSAQLSDKQNQLLQEKINTVQAQKLAQSYWPQLQQALADENGNISAQRMQEWVQTHYAEDPLAKPLQAALSTQLQQQQIQMWKNRADLYRDYLDNPSQQLIGSDKWASGAQQWQETQQLLQAYQAAPDKPSNASVFNQLYEQLIQGQVTESAVEKAFAEQQLSAADTLRLKQVFCSVQAHQTDPREKILFSSLQQFCTGRNLSAEQTQEITYYVYRNGPDFADHLQAAEEVKKMLTLQEK